MTPVRELRITVAGVTIAMISREADLEFAVEEPTARFMNQQGEPDITLHVAWDSTTANGGGEKIFDSGGVWQLFREHDLLVFHLTAPKFGARAYTRAALNPDFASGVVYLRRECVDRDRPLYPLEYPLDELLLTNWLALGRGVEVHACAAIDADGFGYLFSGYSGAGKSTMARLWCEEQQASVLSDDRVILTKVRDEVWMHGTPWHGDEPLASPSRARLHRGFFLQHAAANTLTRVDGAQAVMELFSRSFPPFFSATGLDFTLSFLNDVVERVPFSNLGFIPDRAVPSFIRQS